jgi:hypothetical protein
MWRKAGWPLTILWQYRSVPKLCPLVGFVDFFVTNFKKIPTLVSINQEILKEVSWAGRNSGRLAKQIQNHGSAKG